MYRVFLTQPEQDLDSPYGKHYGFAFIHPEQNAQNHAFFPADQLHLPLYDSAPEKVTAADFVRTI